MALSATAHGATPRCRFRAGSRLADPSARLRATTISGGPSASQRAVDAWRDGVRRALALVTLVRGGLDEFDTLDIGGGFPVPRLGEPAPDPSRFARELPALLDALPADRRPRRLAIEPGRFLVARAGWLVARVLHVRSRGVRQIVLDAGMTELIRPALYGARHDVVALTSLGAPIDRTAILKALSGGLLETEKNERGNSQLE